VSDYPLSPYAEDAAAKLKELELPVPEADKAAVAHMQYEIDHKEKPSLKVRSTSWIRRNPDMSTAARQGDPAMTNLRPTVPPLVPQPAGAGGAFTGDVTATPIGNSTALDTKPDARANPPAQANGAAAAPATSAATPATAASPAPPTADAKPAADQPAADPNAKKKKKNKKQQQQVAAPTTDQPASAQPATATPAAAPATAPSH
jgi:outer membrane protein assembly factor BamD